jgi:integrase
MPRVAKPLKDTEIKNAQPKVKDYSLADGNGLQLKIRTSGKKVWMFNYFRPYLNKRANIKLGTYSAMTLADARKKREEYLSLLQKNIDPQTHKQEQHQLAKEQLKATFSSVALGWLEIKKTKVSDDYALDIKRSLELHAFPILANVPISKLNAPMVISALKPLESKGSLESLRRVLQRINEIMTWAVNTGQLNRNPLESIREAFKKPQVKNQPSITPAELPDFMRSLQRASIKYTTRCLIEWQLHTLTRPAEAAHSEWSEIDFHAATWTIPKERMKMKRDHIIPLTAHALSILDEMKPISSRSKFIFPSDRSIEKPLNEQTANMAIKRMGYKDKLVSHGLRSIGSTALNEEGFAPDIIEAALAHMDKNQVRAAYNRTDYLERRRVMMNWWSEFIVSATMGSNSMSGRRGLKAV